MSQWYDKTAAQTLAGLESGRSGLSPQEAALVVNSCPYGMCRLPPAPTPSAAAV